MVLRFSPFYDILEETESPFTYYVNLHEIEAQLLARYEEELDCFYEEEDFT